MVNKLLPPLFVVFVLTTSCTEPVIYTDSDPHSISIAAMSNGSVVADRSSAVPGTIITLTVASADEYQLKPDSLVYRMESGSRVPISASRFAMPSSDVTVEALFERKLNNALSRNVHGNWIRMTSSKAPGGMTINWDCIEELSIEEAKVTSRSLGGYLNTEAEGYQTGPTDGWDVEEWDDIRGTWISEPAMQIDGITYWKGYYGVGYSLLVFETADPTFIKVYSKWTDPGESHLGFYYMKKNTTADVAGNLTIVGNPAANGREARLALSGVAGISVVVRKINATLGQTVTTDPEGNFTVPAVDVGVSYVAVPEGSSPVEFIPQYEGQDIGTLNSTEKGYNFKVWTSNPNTYLYDGTDYDIRLHIKNVGTASCVAASYSISVPDKVTVTSGILANMLRTVEAGTEKTVDLKINFAELDIGFKDYSFDVSIKDIENNEWKDSFQLRIYDDKGQIQIAVKDAGLGGVVYSEHGQLDKFLVGLPMTIELPRGIKYWLAVMGSGANGETRYSVGVDTIPADDASMQGFLNPGLNEPQDNRQETSTNIPDNTSIISYIHLNDIDIFNFEL